jgi:prepilin-type N-terminal cleavage/methylation domain-containing protein
MPKNIQSKGFSLLEILVVITIIAILSAMGLIIYGSILKDSRDAKRQSDLKTIQSALEQYFADRFYFPNITTGSFPFGSALTNCTGVTSCTVSKTYLNSVPTDPKPSPQPQYYYEKRPSGCDNTPTNRCTSYCLYANMENTSNIAPTGCTFPSGGYDYGVTLP